MANFDVSKLIYVLLAKHYLEAKDVDFISGNIDLDTWKAFIETNVHEPETLPEEETSTAPEVKPSKKPFHTEGDNPIERPDLFND